MLRLRFDLLRDPRANPVTARLTGPGWPSARMTVWLAFGLGLISLIVGVAAWQRADVAGLDGLFNLAFLVMFFAPSVLAAFAATLTAHDARGEPFQLLLLTGLSARDLARGYLLAALYRMRLLLALAVGLMPAFVIGGLVQVVRWDTAIGWLFRPYADMVEFGTLPRTPPDAVGAGLALVAVVLAGWGMIAASAALGTALALRWRGPLVAALVAPPFLLIFACVLLVVYSLGALCLGGWWIVVAALLTPYVVWRWALDQAQRWAWRLPDG